MVHVYFGDGKGKTTAAVGQGIRASGWGMRVIMVQFQKSTRSGEIEAIKKIGGCDGIKFKVIRPDKVKGFFWDLTEEDKTRLKEDTGEAVRMICDMVTNDECDMLILDEILGVVKNGTLDDDDVMRILECRSEGQEIILTGREVSERICSTADYITEMRCVKHPFKRGIKARKGVEY